MEANSSPVPYIDKDPVAADLESLAVVSSAPQPQLHAQAQTMDDPTQELEPEESPNHDIPNSAPSSGTATSSHPHHILDHNSLNSFADDTPAELEPAGSEASISEAQLPSPSIAPEVPGSSEQEKEKDMAVMEHGLDDNPEFVDLSASSFHRSSFPSPSLPSASSTTATTTATVVSPADSADTPSLPTLGQFETSASISTPATTATTTTAAATASASASAMSFYEGLDLDIENIEPEAPTAIAPPSFPPAQAPVSSQPSAPSSPFQTPTPKRMSSGNSLYANNPGAVPGLLAKRTSRVSPGSSISKRINMLSAGKDASRDELFDTPVPVPSTPSFPPSLASTFPNSRTLKDTNNNHTASSSSPSTPDPEQYPDSFFEELLKDQTTISRSFSTLPKPTPRATPVSMPIKIGSTFSSTSSLVSPGPKTPKASTGVTVDSTIASTLFNEDGTLAETDPEVLSSELVKLQQELIKTRDSKVKFEADAKAQRVAVMSLKTEVQFVRNVLKRRETELGDEKDMSGAYETELAELRQKLQEAERQVSRGQGEMEAKIRALERLRDESMERIVTLDAQIKKLKSQVEIAEKKTLEAEDVILGLRVELEDLAPFRDAAIAQKNMVAEEPVKVKELNSQITELEDTRDIQAAMIEELETKITTVEAEALEFKGKAELEYEALSDGFKTLKTRRSEEIRVLKEELEQHKLQEQIIEKLQADIDLLQTALGTVATSQTAENARIKEVTAELNAALASKDQEVVRVQKNMTEFEESHNLLVSSLQATLVSIREEADAAKQSRDEAVASLDTLREELETLRHSLPIPNKHMSLTQWNAEHQQLQQQLKAMQELERIAESAAEEGDDIEEVIVNNVRRKSQQLVLDIEQHLQLGQELTEAQKATAAAAQEEEDRDKCDETEAAKSRSVSPPPPSGSVSVRTMLNFLAQLQGMQTRPAQEDRSISPLEEEIPAAAPATYSSQLQAYLLTLEDDALVEPWAREKELEEEIDAISHRLQALVQSLSESEAKTMSATKALEAAELAKVNILEVKDQEVQELKSSFQAEKDELEREKLELEEYLNLERMEREELEGDFTKAKVEWEEKEKNLKTSSESAVDAQELEERELAIKDLDIELQAKATTLAVKEQDLAAREEELEGFEQDLNKKSKDLTAKEHEIEARVKDVDNRDHSVEMKLVELTEQQEELSLKASTLEEKEQVLVTKEQELVIKTQQVKIKEQQVSMELAEARKRPTGNNGPTPSTPPFSPQATPFGSPGMGTGVLSNMMAAHSSKPESNSDIEDDEDERDMDVEAIKHERRRQTEINQQQSKLIKSLEEKIQELERRPSPGPPATNEDGSPMAAPVGQRISQMGSSPLGRIGSTSLRSSLLSGLASTPPPTIALPPVPGAGGEGTASARSSAALTSEDLKAHGLDRTNSIISVRKMSNLGPLPEAPKEAAPTADAAIAKELAAATSNNKELKEKLEQSTAELAKTQTAMQSLEANLLARNQEAILRQQEEMKRIQEENQKIMATLEEVRANLTKALNQTRAAELAKTQLEAQVQKEKHGKDEALRAQDHLKQRLEDEMKKKKGGFCF